MASYTLYPPTIASTGYAFLTTGACRIYFSLSKYYSSISNISGIHIAIIGQKTNITAVNKTDSGSRIRNTGIIILPWSEVHQNTSGQYYVDILKDDISGGWTAGNFYKIQIRVAEKAYSSSSSTASWLSSNASSFSEWSTYCTVKAVSAPTVKIPLFNYNSTVERRANSKSYVLSLSTLEIDATCEFDSTSNEKLYSYSIDLYKDDALLESSEDIYSNSYQDYSKMHYVFKKELEDNVKYTLVINFLTKNKYSGKVSIIFTNSLAGKATTPFVLKTLEDYASDDTSHESIHASKLAIERDENDYGRLGIKLAAADGSSESLGTSYNVYIRRTDNTSDFSEWEDLMLINYEAGTLFDDLPWYYDYTVESGKWYKYGVEILDSYSDRTVLNKTNPVMREWEYSYLLGEGGKQLRLQFNNTMGSFAWTISEGKTDTIGSKYPFIGRGGNSYYRTFPVNGLISFEMDRDIDLFEDDESIYKYDDVIDLYDSYRTKNGFKSIAPYDVIRERDFRDKVFEFLQDGKPKLFKSPTEGNIIISLMSVAGQPDQTTNRMIYSFTSTAYEIDSCNITNYLKYKFISIGTADSFEEDEPDRYLGQYIANDSENLIDRIWKKYDISACNVGGTKYTLKRLENLYLCISGTPATFDNGVYGFKILWNETPIYLNYNYLDNRIMYDFDEVTFDSSSTLSVVGGDEDDLQVEVNFIRRQSKAPWISSKSTGQISSTIYGVGQLCADVYEYTDLDDMIKAKYEYSDDNTSCTIESLDWTRIEADEGTKFMLTMEDRTKQEIVMNDTRIIDISELGNIDDLILGKISNDSSISYRIQDKYPFSVVAKHIFWSPKASYGTFTIDTSDLTDTDKNYMYTKDIIFVQPTSEISGLAAISRTYLDSSTQHIWGGIWYKNFDIDECIAYISYESLKVYASKESTSDNFSNPVISDFGEGEITEEEKIDEHNSILTLALSDISTTSLTKDGEWHFIKIWDFIGDSNKCHVLIDYSYTLQDERSL